MANSLNNEHRFCFTSYGVGVCIVSNSRDVLEQAVETARSALLGQIVEAAPDKCDHLISLWVEPDGNCISLLDGEDLTDGLIGRNYWKYIDSRIRILIADHAPDVVFVHSGVVGWKGRAILMPGNSHYGKTSLVAELVKCGAEYYSDEYAVLDVEGRVHPFARPLSMRTADGSREDPINVEDLGGRRATGPIAVGWVLLTKYEPESVPDYEFISAGQGVVETVAFTVGPRRFAEYRIKVLKNALSDAIIVKSPRPEAAIFAPKFLEFVDNTTV